LGDSRYKVSQNAIIGNNKEQKAELVLNYVSRVSSIESRARAIALNIKYQRSSIRERVNSGKINIVAFGLAGIDIRFALEEDSKLRGLVSSVVTVNSPHQ
jgi:triacylglycerol esterase/lipase EstA (alpha/beta hydrolase family)